MITIFDTEEDTADAIAKEMHRHLSIDRYPVFCLASGSTPQKSYQQFAGLAGRDDRLKKLKIVSLDEWVGVERTSEGSCYQMLHRDLFSHVSLDDGQIAFFDGMSSDLQQECARIDQFIAGHPITFSLMGVGMNGHIGLNEPDCPVLARSSVVELSETTKKVGQKYFGKPALLEQGITLGLSQIIDSKRVIVAITGERKADIVRELFTNPSAQLPAQELCGYSHIDFFLDAEAARDIAGNKN